MRTPPDIDTFRKTARDWLVHNVPATPAPCDGPEARAYVLSWQKKLNTGGWAGLTWPRAYGGRALSVAEQIVWYEEYAAAGAPSTHDASFVGLNHAGPTIIACGTEAQKARYLPPILAGETLWSQGFSEPEAGSDLAGLRTAGVVDGEHLVVNGQKIWSSYADISDYQELLVRTGHGDQKHKGLTWIICPMTLPGIVIRPIRAISGPRKFCEISFTDVAISLENIVGGLDRGWQTAMSTFAFERGTAALGMQIDLLRKVQDLLRDCPPQRAALRAELAGLVSEAMAMRALSYRVALESEQQMPGADASMVRVFFAELSQKIHAAGVRLYGLADPRVLADRGWGYHYFDAFSETIAGGTSEIQRDLIAERKLNLPRGGSR